MFTGRQGTYHPAQGYNQGIDMTISVKDNIAKAMVFSIKQITTTNGYNNTITNCYNPPIDEGSMNDFPACNYFEGDELCLNTTQPGVHEQTGGNQAKLFLKFLAEFDIWAKDNNDPSTYLNSILADVVRYFGNHWNIPDVNGLPTAFNCMYHSSTKFGVGANSPLFGITVRFIVWYDQKLTDPKLRG